MHMLEEKDSGLYAPNELTILLARPEYAAGIIFWFVTCLDRYLVLWLICYAALTVRNHRLRRCQPI